VGAFASTHAKCTMSMAAICGFVGAIFPPFNKSFVHLELKKMISETQQTSCRLFF
jgi:hypothetical protein